MSTKSIFKTSLVVIMSIIFSGNIHAQMKEELRLSIGVSTGYASTLSYGGLEDSGNTWGIYADFEYKKLIGRLQYTGLVSNSFGKTLDLENGSFAHGSFGYNLAGGSRIYLPLMFTAGVGIIKYNNSAGPGTVGLGFNDISPQLGFTVSPYYKILDQLSVHISGRYMRAIRAGFENQDVNLTDFSLGIRWTI